MERCPRCTTVVEAGWGYCPVCGRPRILESLQAPIATRAWHHLTFRGLVAVVSLWLIVTVAVAFLREFKAVRDGERLMAEAKPQEAWAALAPFLAGHTDHIKAHFLCGKATIRLDPNLRGQARQCLERLGALSPELKVELAKDYAQIITAETRIAGCYGGGFEQVLAGAEELGADFVGSVINGFDSVVEACHASDQDWELVRLARLLVEKNHGMEMIERGYAPVIRRAVAQGRQYDARMLARQAKALVPESAAILEAELQAGTNG